MAKSISSKHRKNIEKAGLSAVKASRKTRRERKLKEKREYAYS